MSTGSSPWGDTVSNILTTGEAAARLGVSDRRVRALVGAGRLPARLATPVEIGSLLETGRIRSVAVTGVRVIEEHDLERVKDRQPGRPRKPDLNSTEAIK
jgi:hypothetical protein